MLFAMHCIQVVSIVSIAMAVIMLKPLTMIALGTLQAVLIVFGTEKLFAVHRGFTMIIVKLYAYLRDNRGKEVEIEHAEGMTIQTIVEQLNIPRDRMSIIICDGKDNAAEKMMTVKPKPDSLIHIFPPVAGG